MKKMIILFLVILLWTPSCALFHLDKLEDKHRRSCGPEALNDVLNCIKGVDWEELNLKKSEQIKLKNLSKEVISKEIRKNGDISRILLGSFNQNAFEITWPSEIETYLESKNIKFKKVKDPTEKEIEGKIVIFLCKGSILRGEWHWITFPTYSLEHIKKVFSDRNEIVFGYIIDG